MDHRRVIASVVAVAAVGTATAVTLPAIASSQPQPDPSARADSVLVSALRRDLNLSDEQARARLRTERWASPTGERLRRQLGARYAGAWLSATGDRLTVAVTDPRLADPVRAAGAEPKIVTRSAGDLDTLKGDLDRRAGTVGDDVPGWYVDVATNSVVVLAKPRARAAAARWAAAGGAPADAVRVVESAENPRPLFDVRGGDAFFAGRGRCSIGFSVVGGFVTAGHCGPVGTQAAGFNRAAQGQVAASVFPGAGDFGFVRVNADWTPRSVVNTSTGGEVPVAGSAEAPVGASICRTGSTTGTRCGVIAAKNATVNYAEGAVSGLTRTDVCAEPGDSGGSWLSGDQAQGVTSGGSGDCTSGGVTFFQPVNEILQTFSLTLVTEDAAEPPPSAAAEPPAQVADQPAQAAAAPAAGAQPPVRAAASVPAADCGAAERTLRGALTGTRARESQPDVAGFAAPAGRRTACLTGPAGANFDLYLQSRTDRGWATVARAAGPGGTERLTFTGPAGVYRYRVVSERGSGAYALTF